MKLDVCLSFNLLLVLCFCASKCASEDICPDWQFYDRVSRTCRDCSKCPNNKPIIREHCTNVSDTVCGRFLEFDHFRNEIPKDREEILVEIDSPEWVDQGQGYDPRIEIKEVPTKSSEDTHWKNLAFALIGMLCVLIIIATMVVWYACRKLQASVQNKRPEDDDSDDADNGYVVIRSLRNVAPPTNPSPTSQTRHHANYHLLRQQRFIRPYQPKRRILNEYSDDVFESEDSAGSRTSRRVLSSIPEQNDESVAPSAEESLPNV